MTACHLCLGPLDILADTYICPVCDLHRRRPPVVTGQDYSNDSITLQYIEPIEPTDTQERL